MSDDIYSDFAALDAQNANNIAQRAAIAARPVPQDYGLLGNTLAAHVMGTLGTTGQRFSNALGGLFGLQPDTQDYYKVWGGDSTKPGIADNVAQSAIEMIPAFKAARGLGIVRSIASPFLSGVAENAAAGAIHGGMFGDDQGQNKIAQGAEEGLGGAGIGALFGAAGQIGKPVASYIGNRLLSPLLEKAAPMIQEVSQKFPWSQTQQDLRANYGQASKDTSSAYQNLKSTNAAADSSGAPFSSENFVARAQSQLPDIGEEIKGNPQLQEAYAPTIGILQNALENPPQTFAEAASKVKNINAAMKLAKQAIGTKDEFLNSVSGDLKSALNKDIQQSSELPSAAGINPYDALQQANAANIAKKAFTSMPQPSGANKLKVPLKEFYGTTNDADQSILKSYMPNQGYTGTGRFEVLQNSLGGDKEAAAGALQGHIFQQSMQNGTPDLGKVLTQYNKFSPEQRDYIFNPEQKNYLDSAAKIQTQFKNNKIGDQGSNHDNWLNHLLALGAAHSLFGPAGTAVTGAALLANKTLGKSLASRYATPEGVQAIQRMKASGFNTMPAARAANAFQIAAQNPSMRSRQNQAANQGSIEDDFAELDKQNRM